MRYIFENYRDNKKHQRILVIGPRQKLPPRHPQTKEADWQFYGLLGLIIQHDPVTGQPLPLDQFMKHPFVFGHLVHSRQVLLNLLADCEEMIQDVTQHVKDIRYKFEKDLEEAMQ